MSGDSLWMNDRAELFINYNKSENTNQTEIYFLRKYNDQMNQHMMQHHWDLTHTSSIYSRLS